MEMGTSLLVELACQMLGKKHLQSIISFIASTEVQYLDLSNFFIGLSRYMMQRLSSITRLLASSTRAVTGHASSCLYLPRQSISAFTRQPCVNKLHQEIPGDFPKWSSFGFCRGSKFATGFSPLQYKPLNSIMDIERVKDRTPEDIASVWDDVMYFVSDTMQFH